ncbi:hypothetical protein [Lentibacillus saliphilus]|nr:hypothetical protein [Lentibacillus saliphilus]
MKKLIWIIVSVIFVGAAALSIGFGLFNGMDSGNEVHTENISDVIDE